MSKLVLITGASGFIGSHIVDELLANNYRVRASARPPKVESLRSKYSKYGDQFEAVAIADVGSGTFPEVFDGVAAVIHTASALPTRAANPDEILHSAEEGTLNIARQAEKAGIKRFVFTSSAGTVANSSGSFTDKDWNPTSWDDAAKGGNMPAYAVAKTLAEKKLWAFAEAHPHFDVTTINPPFCYGNFATGFSVPTPEPAQLSSNIIIYYLLFPNGQWPIGRHRYVDVRDVAKAHVRALKSPLSSSPGIGRKRLVFGSPYNFDYTEFVQIIKTKRPQFADRLIKAQPQPLSYANMPVDLKRMEQVLGMKKEDYYTVEQTLLDAVDAIIALEKQWVDDGHELPKEIELSGAT